MRRALLAAGLLMVAAAVCLEALNLYTAAGELRAGVRDIHAAQGALGADPAGWTAATVHSAADRQAGAQRHLDASESRLRSDPLLSLLAGVPWVKGQVRAARDLATAAAEGGRAAGDVIGVARAYTAARDQTGDPGPRLLALLADAAPPLTDADRRLREALRDLRRDRSDNLLPPLLDRVNLAIATLGPAQARAGAAADAATRAPAALGAGGPKSYLVLFANPAELRPAGGFAGAVGVVTVVNGAPGALEVHSQDYYNNLYRQTFPIPYPLGRYFKFSHGSLEIGDAGWDPDFPTTARLSRAMYESATGHQVDGVASIDPYVVSAILGITGPVDIPGYGSFDAVNFFPKFDYIVNVSTAPGSGHEAMAPITSGIFASALAQPTSRWPQLLEAVQVEARSRHIQLAISDPAIAAELAAANFDGAIRPAAGDYLFVADGNVHATKSDYYMHRTMTVKVEAYPNGLDRHEVLLTYELPLPVDETDRRLSPNDGSYGDYVRFYLPETSTVTSFLVSLDGRPGGGSLDRVTNDHGKRVVGGYFLLPRGHTATVRLDYETALPSAGRVYRLLVQKQAGIPGLPTLLQVSHPGGVTERNLDLTTDASFEVGW